MFSAGSVRRWLKFGLVGGLNTAVDYGIFALLSACGFPYWAAQCVSYFGGTLNSYIWNRSWTFRDRVGTSKGFYRFFGLNLATLVLTTASLYFAAGRWGWPVLAAKLAATVLGMIVNYAGSSRWAFRESRISERSDVI